MDLHLFTSAEPASVQREIFRVLLKIILVLKDKGE